MSEKEQIWFEVDYIPNWVKPKDRLSFRGKYFVKKEILKRIEEINNVVKNQ